MVARLLWEQDVAGSNPVTPIAKQVSPTLTSQPPSQGGFFIAWRGLCESGAKNPLARACLSHDFPSITPYLPSPSPYLFHRSPRTATSSPWCIVCRQIPFVIPLDTPIKTQREQKAPSVHGELAAVSFVRDCTKRDECMAPNPKQALFASDDPSPVGIPPRATLSNCAYKSCRNLCWLQEELVNPASGNQTTEILKQSDHQPLPYR